MFFGGCVRVGEVRICDRQYGLRICEEGFGFWDGLQIWESAAMACFVGGGGWRGARVSVWTGSRVCLLRTGGGEFASGVSRKGVRMASVGAGWGRTATEDELKTSPPKLYVYDHCPFCVRCRMIFGLRKEPYDLVFLANDDARTPTRLIGKKILPILEVNGKAMGESLDIIKTVEGSSPMLKPSTGRTDLQSWLNDYAMVQRKLIRPRTSGTPLAEFQSKYVDGDGFF